MRAKVAAPRAKTANQCPTFGVTAQFRPTMTSGRHFKLLALCCCKSAGGTVQWANDTYALYGEVSVNTNPADTSDNDAYKGTVGLRAK
jgi:hypothetical protein